MWVPRSLKAMPEPLTRSFTVLWVETFLGSMPRVPRPLDWGRATAADRRYPRPQARPRPSRTRVGRGGRRRRGAARRRLGRAVSCSTRSRPAPSGSWRAGAITTAQSCGGACPNAPTRRWAGCGSPSCTRRAPPPGGRRGWPRSIPTPMCWCSATATSRGTPPPKPACACSIRDRRPTGGGNRSARI